MVRPELGIVIVLADVVNFVLGLDVTMLGHPKIDANSGRVDSLEIDARIGNGFL